LQYTWAGDQEHLAGAQGAAADVHGGSFRFHRGSRYQDAERLRLDHELERRFAAEIAVDLERNRLRGTHDDPPRALHRDVPVREAREQGAQGVADEREPRRAAEQVDLEEPVVELAIPS